MSLIDSLNKNFESRVRLGIMSILIVHEWVSYKELKKQLGLTDGNLASHLAALEKAGYIEVKKEFLGRKPNTSYRVTKSGREDFKKHIETLEKLINQN